MILTKRNDYCGLTNICMILPDGYIEQSIDLLNESKIISHVQRSFPEGTEARHFERHYLAMGYKEILTVSEYEEEITAKEGQEEMLFQHNESIERGELA